MSLQTCRRQYCENCRRNKIEIRIIAKMDFLPPAKCERENLCKFYFKDLLNVFLNSRSLHRLVVPDGLTSSLNYNFCLLLLVPEHRAEVDEGSKAFRPHQINPSLQRNSGGGVPDFSLLFFQTGLQCVLVDVEVHEVRGAPELSSQNVRHFHHLLVLHAAADCRTARDNFLHFKKKTESGVVPACLSSRQHHPFPLRS